MAEQGVDTVISGGLVVTATAEVEASIAIKDGRIAAIGSPGSMPSAEREIDASGRYVLPGPIDGHAHFRGWEDFELAGKMAAKSGLTTIIPFGEPRHVDHEGLPAATTRISDEINAGSVIDMGLHLMLGADPYVFEGIPAAMEMGIRSFKAFMTYKSRRPRTMVDDEFIIRAMELIGGNGGVMQLHCENGDVIDYLEKRFRDEGRVKPTDFPDVAPPWVEEEAINRAIALAKMTGSPLYIVHLSTQLGLERIKRAQAEGLPIWTETCPQYLLLAAEDHEKWGPLLKIGPPLRYRDGGDHEALWEGLAAGFISCVSSDHSPHPYEDKMKGEDNVFFMPDGVSPVPFGAPSMETLAPVMYSKGAGERGFGPRWFARVMAENPARIFGLYPRKGTIQVGSDADLAFVDPARMHIIREANMLGKAGFTPYEGMELKGAITMTLLRGEVLMEDGEIKLGPEYGQFLESGPPVAPLGGRVG
ncbi:MAG: amidohydrolase family protein [Chloroflexi bacterium]|nr:amidohydrolase family protein [Chloroflexota bacterium]